MVGITVARWSRAEAINLAEAICDEARSGYLFAVIRTLYDAGQEIPDELVEYIPEEQRQFGRVFQIAQSAVASPDPVIEQILELPLRARNQPAYEIGRACGMNNPKIGIELMRRLPKAQRDRFATRFAYEWAVREPRQAQPFIKSAEYSGDRDSAFGALALGLSATDGSAALSLLSENVTDSFRQWRHRQMVLKHWASSDPEGMKGWLGNQPRSLYLPVWHYILATEWAGIDSDACFPLRKS